MDAIEIGGAMMRRIAVLTVLCGLLIVACNSGIDAPADLGGPDAIADVGQDSVQDVDQDTGQDAWQPTDDGTHDQSAEDEEPADTGPKLPPYDEPALHVHFDLAATPVDTPYPYDYYLDSDDGHILLDTGAFSAELLPLMADAGYPEQLALCHGFATYTFLSFLASAAVDPAELPTTPEATIDDDSPVLLLQMGPDGAPVARVPFNINTRDFIEDDGDHHLVSLTPLTPLVPEARYALVIYDRLQAVGGDTYGMSRGFAQVMGIAAPPTLDAQRTALFAVEAARLQALVPMLPDATHVIAAVDFTTGNAATEMEGVMARFEDPNDPEMQITVNLDPDGDESPNVWTDGTSPDCPMEPGELGLVIQGTFQPINFTSPKGRFEFKDGRWTVFPPKDVAFSLMVPAGPGPYPVVMLAHGIESSPGAMCRNARDVVREGMAVLRWELPRHGSRGGGGYDFLALNDLLRIRDNFRQGATEIASLTMLLDSLHSELTVIPEEGDPVPPAFDTNRIGFLGHSLGAIIGLLGMPFSERIKVWVSNVGGVGMIHLVELALVKQFADLNAMFLSVGVLHLGSHAMWGGDGVTFAHRMLSHPYNEAHAGKCLLAQEVIDDDTISNQSAELLARGAGLPLVRPVQKSAPGLDEVDAADVSSGLFQFDGIGHDAFTGNPTNDSEILIRKQAYIFLKRGLYDGACEIVTSIPD